MQYETNLSKKLILWIQDPRPKYEWDEIETVKLFTETNYYNQKIYDLVHDWNEHGRVKFISQGYFSLSKTERLLYWLATVTCTFLISSKLLYKDIEKYTLQIFF